VLAAFAVLLLGSIAGCGEEGVAEDATVSVYVGAALCGEAKEELGRRGSRLGQLRLRVVCVDDAGRAGESRLAAIGAAARLAVEDSTSIAYIGSADPTSTRFSEPILEEAGIPRISSSSGKAATAHLLKALKRTGDPVNPRESLLDELQ
jgi:ABC-type branched-subunit amino acid transport system substrate-binding protein